MMLACLLMVGCQEEELFPDYGEGTGTLVISGLEVETVVGDIQTRASVEDEDIPENEEFMITLVDKENSIPLPDVNAEGKYDLPAGSYTITAYYGANRMSNEPYFFETKDLVIETGKTRTVTLMPSLQTAVLRPHLDETLVNQYENYKLEIKNGSGEIAELTNDKDFYLPVGDSYTLTLSGTNKLGNPVSHTWEYQADQFVKAVRYTVNCNPDIPSFTLPAQAATNAWSKFIYVTPMTEENISYVPENMTKAEVLADIVYEASADGQTWTPATTDGDKVVITGLEPSKAYTVRARYGGVEGANPATLTTENAQELRDGNMDTWESVKVANAYGLQAFYNYYLGSQNDHIWETNNAEGLNGATTDAFTNMGTYWRWCAGTQNTSDVSKLGQNTSSSAAEISTLGFYTDKISGVYAGTIDSDEIIPDWLGYKNRNRICLGLLYVDKTSLSSRPSSISFDYKYEPVTGDLAPVELVLYDANSNELWSESMNLGTQEEYMTKKVTIDRSLLEGKNVSYVTIRFQSGTNRNYSLMHIVEGDYDTSPRVKDRVVGSVLKIDNVVLNYDYE